NCFRHGQINYPTRNFATLGPFIVVTPLALSLPLKGSTHFWSTLTVAREIGLSHLSKFRRGRRIVSEDSRCRIASLSAAVHSLSELENGDVVGIAQDTLAQECNRSPEQLVVLCLPADWREPIEERHDPAGYVREAVD